jgi:hypothetical protein
MPTSNVALAAGIFLLVLVILGWGLIPPFPSPSSLLGDPVSHLTAVLGAPTEQREGSFLWQETRGFVEWSLEVSLDASPEGLADRPRSISRCASIFSVEVFPLCKFAIDGRILVPNNRFER